MFKTFALAAIVAMTSAVKLGEEACDVDAMVDMYVEMAPEDCLLAPDMYEEDEECDIPMDEDMEAEDEYVWEPKSRGRGRRMGSSRGRDGRGRRDRGDGWGEMDSEMEMKSNRGRGRWSAGWETASDSLDLEGGALVD